MSRNLVLAIISLCSFLGACTASAAKPSGYDGRYGLTRPQPSEELPKAACPPQTARPKARKPLQRVCPAPAGNQLWQLSDGWVLAECDNVERGGCGSLFSYDYDCPGWTDAVTIQNESLNSGNTPSMPWEPQDQARFISQYLGPKFQTAGLDTDIIVFDHNCDRPDYPLTIYSKPEAARYVSGAAFHHYRGDLSAMSYVHQARPDKDVYFTEQMTTERPGSESIAIAPAVSRLLVGITRNWSRDVILWNLAANSLNEPHTDNGGCTMCQGAVTIDGDRVGRNIAYYVIAHASKLVRPGACRIASTAPWQSSIALCEDEQHPGAMRMNVAEHSGVLPNVAFRTPQGRIVLIVANESFSTDRVYIQYNGQFAELPLAPGSVSTFVWNE